MQIVINKAIYPLLIKLINETYTDQVEQITTAHINEAGDIVAIALDEDRVIGFKYTDDDKVALKLLNPEILDDDPSALEDLDLLPDLDLPTVGELNIDDATPAKRIIQWQGFDIGLQYFPFDKRHGKVLQAAYGHFRKTRGADGMAVDVYVGSNLKSPKVFAIDQLINGKFDEQKMVIGVDSLEDAIGIYLSAMPEEMMGNAKEISLDELRSYKVNFETKVDAEPFKPNATKLPQLSGYDELLNIDWNSVRNLAEEEGWTWEEKSGKYNSDNGLVNNDDILRVTYRELDKLESQVRAIAAQLTQGTIDTAEWERQIARIVVVATALFFVFGVGGKVGRIGAAEQKHVEGRLRTQLEYLRTFSEGILKGEMTGNGIGARAELYIQDAQLHYAQAQEMIHSAEDWPYYANILGSCRHCKQCPDETAQGIVARGELTPIGERACRWRCCCTFEYFKDRSGRQDSVTLLGARGHGWVGGL